jgi:hypothetical protein
MAIDASTRVLSCAALRREFAHVLDLKRVVESRDEVLERLRRRGSEAEESLLSADPWALDPGAPRGH